MADYAGACHRAALCADPLDSDPPCEPGASRRGTQTHVWDRVVCLVTSLRGFLAMTVCQPLDASWVKRIRPSSLGKRITGGKRMGSPFYTAEHEAYREV